MSFSGAVKIADLNDYLQPSQSCIKPLMKSKDKIDDTVKRNDDINNSSGLQVEMDISSDNITPQGFQQIRDVATSGSGGNSVNSDAEAKKAMITLNDCLACSGCVTSAETVLITAQSTQEFLTQLRQSKERHKIVIVTIAPQPLTSLAHYYHLTDIQMYKKLTTYMKNIGVDHVLNTTTCLDISLIEAQHEFVSRYREKHSDILKQYYATHSDLPMNGNTVTATLTSPPSHRNTVANNNVSDALPIISSECFPPDHQLLTLKGFKFVDEIDYNDEIATYNESTQSIEYHKPYQVIVKPHSTYKMVDFIQTWESENWDDNSGDYGGNISGKRGSNMSNRIALSVTADHDMYIRTGRRQGTSSRNVWWKESEKQFHKVKAHELIDDDVKRVVKVLAYANNGVESQIDSNKENVYISNNLTPAKRKNGGKQVTTSEPLSSRTVYPLPILRDAVSDTNVTHDMKLPRVFVDIVSEYACPYDFIDILGLRTADEVAAFVEFYGYWLGDGSMEYISNNGYYNAIVTAPVKKLDHGYLKQLFARFPLTQGTDYIIAHEDVRQQVRYRIINRVWFKYFDDVYGYKYQGSTHYVIEIYIKSTKELLFEWVWCLSKELLRKLLYGYRVADGRKGDGADEIYTSSVIVRDNLLHLMLRAGYSAFFQLKYEKGSNRSILHGRQIAAKHNSWRLTYSDHNRSASPVLLSHSDIKERMYTGKVYCVSVKNHLVIARRAHRNADNIVTKASKPMIVGQCPGWICYAEKTQGEFILPYTSAVKSPQQITGALIKKYYGKHLGVKASDIYHTTIMPCYDKKLEAIRPDFHLTDVEYADQMEVDCVLATTEIQQMIKDDNLDISALAESSLDPLFSSTNQEQTSLYRPMDTGASGGYAECIYRYAAKHLFNIDIPHDQPLQWQTARNADFRELTLLDSTTKKPLLRFALAYGFRNIQNITRQIKQNRCKYHYVEVMACPSGCLNGGGQIKAEGDIKAQKQLVQSLDQQYHDDLLMRDGAVSNPIVPKVYNEWLHAAVGSDIAKRLFYTQYHAVESMDVNPLAIKW